MKRMNIGGLSLLALVAFGAISASSASAGEYFKCIKVQGGKYADKSCEVLAVSKPGRYERVSAVGTTAASGSHVWFIETSQGEIICNREYDEVEITGPKTDVDRITWERCTNTMFGTPCLNTGVAGRHGGTIHLNLLTRLIDFPETGSGGHAGPVAGEVWDEFGADGSLGPYLAVFHCETPLGEDPFAITGTAAGRLTPTDVATSKAAFEISGSVGEQNLTTHTASAEPPYSEVALESVLVGTERIKYGNKIVIAAL